MVVTTLRILFLVSFSACLFVSSAVQSAVEHRLFSLLDKTDRLSAFEFSKIPNHQLITEEKLELNYNFTKHPVWVKIYIKNLDNDAWIVVENAHVDYLDFYSVSKGKITRSLHSGDLRSFSNRDFPFHYINFNIPKGTDMILMRAQSEGSLSLPLQLFEKEHFTYLFQKDLTNACYISVTLIIVLINLLYFIFFREKIYLYYILYALSLIIVTGIDFGYHFQFLFPDIPSINRYNIIFYTASIFIYLFSEKFLNLKQNHRLFYRIFQFTYASVLIIGIYSLVDYSLSIQLYSVWILLFQFIIPFAALKIYLRTKNKAIGIFLLGWIFPLIMVIFYTASIFGWLTNVPIWFPLFQFFSVAESLVIMIAVLYKVNQIKEENLESKTQLVLLMKEKETYLSRANEVLEQKVLERTEELEEKNKEIQSQNEEMIAQNEELQNQKEEIESQWEIQAFQKRQIEEANDSLLAYQQTLENQVNIRTHELWDSTQTLLIRNQQLEEFTYVVAHNLRGPVATLLGLVNIYRITKKTGNQIEFEDYFSKSEEMVQRIDDVIKGLMQILLFEDNKGEIFSTFPLEPIIDDVKVLLNNEISHSHATITHQIASPDSVYGVPVFLNSILYNLISNAIKYSSPTTPPLISIRTMIEGTTLHLYVSDNGLGIDLNNVGAKIFQLFSKLSEHSNGMGIGLYTVRMQVRAMKGSIEVESTPNEGTTFKITLPLVSTSKK